MKTKFAFLMTCLLAGGTMFGAPPPKKPVLAPVVPARREAPPFRVADTNNDGRIGPQEFAVADPGKGAFARWDTNKNGFLSPPEYAAYLAANRGPGGPRP